MTSLTLILQVDGYEQQIQLEQSVRVNELFDFIQSIMNISSRTEDWTCFSSVQNRFMSRDEEIQGQQNDSLIIETKQQSAKIDIKQEQSPQIPLSIIIENGNSREEIEGNYDIQTSLNEIAESILIHCQLNQQQNPPFVSLMIQNQAYNDVIKRSKSLAQLQIKNYTKIEARIN
ncbi:unnamed protein product (macronuclear) [Paramecium tetraurelia]|uniref:Uncharacterized protein n=1 Tax=Paramecium tetraurelia TaxID=5888 RepID=A0D3A5_PARTE|nr:uncharacterized protein GSPATT00013007001 [Paramecium tetraurelia]CAK77522.1 unnamed protein product [Paramecium tetraurelia]|eukprot:XP_001444919.1 hypothetical protein (macronuclear) [Paramecium tetraurelia strain d4-2]